ncbi:MAG: hypothetical protein ACNFW9_04355 [Candidatus Kerfeldbacteria bacterium]
MTNQQTDNTKKIKEMVEAYSEFKKTMEVLRTDQRHLIKKFVETMDKSKADDILNKIKKL